MSIIISGANLTCSDCDDVVTPKEQRTTNRVHQTNQGNLLCECCYEDYLEKFYPSEED